MSRLFVYALISILSMFTGNPAWAEASLRIVSPSLGIEKTLSESDLRGFAQFSVVTSNEYVDGEKVFSGPLLRDIFKLCEIATSETVRVIATNDYEVEIAVDEFYKYDVILAMSMDGVALTSRDKGPIWLIYPMKDHRELREPSFSSRLVWHMDRLEY